jgi:hypothetical protein
MKSIRKVALACVASAMMALPLNAAAQGPVNQDTFFTFSQAVELPGTTLPAGTYFFQLADSPSNRHIVKVMSQDRTQLHATLLAIPFYSNDRPPDEPQVRFMETPAQATGGSAATTNAIKIWFYPGNSVGHEFIYPRSQALKIAARTNQPVLTTKTESEVTAESELTRVNETGVDTAVDTSNRSTTTAQQTTTAQAQPTTATPTEAQRETSTQASAQTQAQTEQTRTTQQPMTRQTDTRTTDTTARTQSEAPATDRADVNRDTRRTELPNTAGVLPLLAVIGIGSLVGSRLLRRTRRV